MTDRDTTAKVRTDVVRRTRDGRPRPPAKDTTTNEQPPKTVTRHG